MINSELIADLFNPDPAWGRDRMLVGTGATAPLPDMGFRWATVVDPAASPLEVVFDGDADPVPVNANLAPSLRSGERVWCQLFGRRVIVLGSSAAGGTATAAGNVEITGSNAGQTSATITFPAGRFPPGSTPIVTATPVSTSPQTNQVSVGAATNTSVTIYLFRNATSATIPINWQATLDPGAA